MKMLKTFWLKYKIAIFVGALLAYTFAVWHVTTTYNEASLLKQEVDKLHYNINLGQEVQHNLDVGLQKYFAKAKPITKEIQREIVQNTIYSDCKSTDGVLRNYQDKLNNQ